MTKRESLGARSRTALKTTRNYCEQLQDQIEAAQRFRSERGESHALQHAGQGSPEVIVGDSPAIGRRPGAHDRAHRQGRLIYPDTGERGEAGPPFFLE